MHVNLCDPAFSTFPERKARDPCRYSSFVLNAMHFLIPFVWYMYGKGGRAPIGKKGKASNSSLGSDDRDAVYLCTIV